MVRCDEPITVSEFVSLNLMCLARGQVMATLVVGSVQDCSVDPARLETDWFPTNNDECSML